MVSALPSLEVSVSLLLWWPRRSFLYIGASWFFCDFWFCVWATYLTLLWVPCLPASLVWSSALSRSPDLLALLCWYKDEIDWWDPDYDMCHCHFANKLLKKSDNLSFTRPWCSKLNVRIQGHPGSCDHKKQNYFLEVAMTSSVIEGSFLKESSCSYSLELILWMAKFSQNALI